MTARIDAVHRCRRSPASPHGLHTSAQPKAGQRFLRFCVVGVGLVIALTGVAGAAGCSKSPQSSSAPARDSGELQAGTAVDKAAGQPGEGAPKQPQGAAPQQIPPGGATAPTDPRAVSYAGTITVRLSTADGVDSAAAQASNLAVAAGGFVGADKRTADEGRSRAQLVLRVPSGAFSSVVDQLGKLGKETSRELSTEDVTAKVVDVDARIATAQASVDRVRALLARAQTIGEIVALESELARREGDLESLKATKRRLDDLTSLSTVRLVLLGPDAAGAKKSDPGFLDGLKAGGNSLLASFKVLLLVLGALVPWLVALGVPLFAILWTVRRLRRRTG